MKNSGHLLPAVVLLCLAAGIPWSATVMGATGDSNPQGACTRLVGMQIEAKAIGLPTSGAAITSTVFVRATEAGNRSGEYCRVDGAIDPVDPAAPKILFRANLPTNWNGKAF